MSRRGGRRASRASMRTSATGAQAAHCCHQCFPEWRARAPGSTYRASEGAPAITRAGAGTVPSGEAEMSVRAIIAAICVAASRRACGHAGTRRRVREHRRDGYAVVGTDVDAVSATTPLSGSVSWMFGLYSRETSDLTDVRIHVAPRPARRLRTCPRPRSRRAARSSTTCRRSRDGRSRVRILPRRVARHRDPGTHAQTLTVTLTPGQAPLGYTFSYLSVDIVGYTGATNGAVVSVPSSASVTAPLYGGPGTSGALR